MNLFRYRFGHNMIMILGKIISKLNDKFSKILKKDNRKFVALCLMSLYLSLVFLNVSLLTNLDKWF